MDRCDFESLLCNYWFSVPGIAWEYARGGSIANSLVSPVFDHTLGSTEGSARFHSFRLSAAVLSA